MTRLARPYMAGTAHEVVGKLLLGNWVIFDHQWGRSGPDPAMWREIVQAACEQENVPVAFITIPRHDLTVVVNPARQPSFDQVCEAINAILHHRWTDKPIPTQAQARREAPQGGIARGRHRLQRG
ncbi:hypothetical protein [Amycolatopsis vastitatis]|uniref:hypothetical protein n=1 Tax=Amycolatopsis vastitatis TaxID=1905142 RepID=UPI00196AFE60|nr:hypothetical protein [Amycolatopsis vastitatis]